MAYGSTGPLLDFAKVGAAVALFRWILQHPVSTISARPKGSLRYQFYLWNAAFLCLLAFGFLGKVSDTYSRGTILLFYLSGLPLLIMWQELWKRFVREGFTRDGLPSAMACCWGRWPRSTSSGANIAPASPA